MPSATSSVERSSFALFNHAMPQSRISLTHVMTPICFLPACLFDLSQLSEIERIKIMANKI